jgi:hypothetical protein
VFVLHRVVPIEDFMTLKRHPNAPRHACPFLAQAVPSPHHRLDTFPESHSSAEHKIIQWLKQGAQILLDLKVRRAVVLHASSGWNPLMEITIRMLGILVRRGFLIRTGGTGSLVQYAQPGRAAGYFAYG